MFIDIDRETSDSAVMKGGMKPRESLLSVYQSLTLETGRKASFYP